MALETFKTTENESFYIEENILRKTKNTTQLTKARTTTRLDKLLASCRASISIILLNFFTNTH